MIWITKYDCIYKVFIRYTFIIWLLIVLYEWYTLYLFTMHKESELTLINNQSLILTVKLKAIQIFISEDVQVILQRTKCKAKIFLIIKYLWAKRNYCHSHIMNEIWLHAWRIYSSQEIIFKINQTLMRVNKQARQNNMPLINWPCGSNGKFLDMIEVCKKKCKYVVIWNINMRTKDKLNCICLNVERKIYLHLSYIYMPTMLQ